jgi:hypothetical protein
LKEHSTLTVKPNVEGVLLMLNVERWMFWKMKKPATIAGRRFFESDAIKPWPGWRRACS